LAWPTRPAAAEGELRPSVLHGWPPHGHPGDGACCWGATHIVIVVVVQQRCSSHTQSPVSSISNSILAWLPRPLACRESLPRPAVSQFGPCSRIEPSFDAEMADMVHGPFQVRLTFFTIQRHRRQPTVDGSIAHGRFLKKHRRPKTNRSLQAQGSTRIRPPTTADMPMIGLRVLH